MGTHWPEGVLQSCETNRTDHDKHSSTITIQYREKSPEVESVSHVTKVQSATRSETGAGQEKGERAPNKIRTSVTFSIYLFCCCEQRPAPSSSHHIAAVVQWTTLHLGGAYDAPHRVSRRHLGFGRFLPRIEGPVLVAVERAQNNQKHKKQNVGAGREIKKKRPPFASAPRTKTSNACEKT